MASPLELHKRARLFAEAVLHYNEIDLSDLSQGRAGNKVGPLTRKIELNNRGEIEVHFRCFRYLRKTDGALMSDYDPWCRVGNYRFIVHTKNQLAQLQSMREVYWEDDDGEHNGLDWIPICTFSFNEVINTSKLAELLEKFDQDFPL